MFARAIQRNLIPRFVMAQRAGRRFVPEHPRQTLMRSAQQASSEHLA